MKTEFQLVGLLLDCHSPTNLGEVMSEFGTGYGYCLGLFLAHAERVGFTGEPLEKVSWFDGAVDHLAGIQIPNSYSISQKIKIRKWLDKMWTYKQDYDGKGIPKTAKAESILMAKELLLEYDLQNCINAEKGDFQ